MFKFKRLVRFENRAGKTCYGEASTVPWQQNLVGESVNVYDGGEPWDDGFKITDKKDLIAKVLCPLESTPIVQGVGLNYRQHAEEANVNDASTRQVNLLNLSLAQFPVPPFPTIFNKPSDALAGPYDDVPIGAEAKWLDYEGELCVIIGKDCKNLSSADNPQDYILGYAAGNDVSARHWQQPAESGNQHGYAKSFDKFAPIGPVICSPEEISDPSKLRLQTWVNGERRQTTLISDLIFDVDAIIRHLSRGRTLRRGTVIMSGTPSGVAAFLKPPVWLKNGDVVEVEIDRIGRIRNTMVFES